MFSVTDVDDGVAEVHPHPRVEGAGVQHVGLQPEHAELVGAGVEALLQLAQDEGEVRGGAALHVQVEVVPRVVAAHQRVLAVGAYVSA